MNIHKNVSMTPRGRAHLVHEIDRTGLRPAAAGLSESTARKWQRRWASQGASGLLDPQLSTSSLSTTQRRHQGRACRSAAAQPAPDLCVGFSLMLADEKAASACAFVLAALRYYKTLGVKVHSAMTDNGSACKSRRFAKLLRRLGIKHIRTRPYTPRTNGKAERFIQTLLREWAYTFIYPSSEHRARELRPWMYHYDSHRPHSATSHRPPITRLGFDGNNVVRNYS